MKTHHKTRHLFDLRTVDYFLTVVARRSLRAAAQELGVTQPALTKAVRRLEDSFGAPLFDRQARGVTPTVYGTALLRHAKDVRAALGAAWEEVEALRTGSAGLVKIGAGPSWQDAVLPDAIAELRTSRPGVRVHVMGGGDDQLKEHLKSGALDFVLAAVPETPRLEPELAWQPLLADEYCIIADVGHPLRDRRNVRVEDLLGYPWILPPGTTYMVGRLNHLLRAAGLPPPVPAIETDVIALKFALMRDSNYLSYHASAHLAGVDPGFIEPLNVPGTRAVRQAGLINRRGIESSPAAKTLVGILERRCVKLRSKR
jgi:DNA-binding transcriptional LysR family regulator